MGSLYSVSSTTGDVTTAGSFISNTTSTGLLFPRLTTAQRDAISSPSAGMQIYNTDTNKDEFYNGSVWGPIDTGITQLTSDVTAGPGSGSQAATVASVGGSSASNIHSAELAANAATDANTFSTIVKRDGSGNFSATTITASLTGHASADLALTGGTLTGDLTLANEHAVIFNDTEISPKSVTLEAPTTITTSYTLKWPVAQGGASTTLQNDGSGNLSWASGGGSGITQLTGDVTAGPGSGSQVATLSNGVVTGPKITAGSVATGTLTVVNFAALSGATFQINGFTFTEGVDWTASTSNQATANSIVSIDFLNTFGLPIVATDGSGTTTTVTFTTLDKGEHANYSLSSSDNTNLHASGATLTGGVGDFTLPSQLTIGPSRDRANVLMIKQDTANDIDTSIAFVRSSDSAVVSTINSSSDGSTFWELDLRPGSSFAWGFHGGGNLTLPNLTTVQRDSLSPTNPGDFIFNSDTGLLDWYNGSWEETASKAYVDNLVNGLSWKQPVLATSAGVTLNNIFLGGYTVSGGATILTQTNPVSDNNDLNTFPFFDGITVSNGNRVLIREETTGNITQTSIVTGNSFTVSDATPLDVGTILNDNTTSTTTTITAINYGTSTVTVADATNFNNGDSLTWDNKPFNGIYIVTNTGTAGSVAWVLTRSVDMDTWAEVPAAATFVEEGTTFTGSAFVCTSAPGGTLGATDITFVIFSGGASGVLGSIQYSDGSGHFLSSPLLYWDAGNSAFHVAMTDPGEPSIFLSSQDFSQIGFETVDTNTTVAAIQSTQSNGRLEIISQYVSVDSNIMLRVFDSTNTEHQYIFSPTSIIFPGRSTNPSSPTEGQLYYNNSTHLFTYWNGSTWKQLATV